MTRRFTTRSPARALTVLVGWTLGSAALLGAIACQGPAVQGEPARTRAPAPSTAAPIEPAPATDTARAGAGSPSAAVGLAKYEAPAPALPAVAPSSAKTVAPSAGAVAAADAPSKASPGQPVQGTVVTEEPFSAWLQAVSPVTAGGPTTVEAVLEAKPPYHCNAEYPHKFKLGAAPAGLSYPEATVKGAQVTRERSVLRIPVIAQSPGKATVSGTLQFSVCTDERCLVEKRDLALNLEVK